MDNVFRYKYCVPKPVTIQSQNGNIKSTFKTVFYDETGTSFVVYNNIIYEHVGACKLTGKMMFKKSKDRPKISHVMRALTV